MEDCRDPLRCTGLLDMTKACGLYCEPCGVGNLDILSSLRGDVDMSVSLIQDAKCHLDH
jgi:hypothetical protein